MNHVTRTIAPVLILLMVVQPFSNYGVAKKKVSAEKEERLVFDELADVIGKIEGDREARDELYKLLIGSLWETKEKKVVKDGKEEIVKEKVFRYEGKREGLLLLERALRVGESIKDENIKLEALNSFPQGIGVLSKTNQAGALRIAEVIRDKNRKFNALFEIAKNLSTTAPERAAAVIKMSLKAAEGTKEWYSKIISFAYIVNFISKTDPEMANAVFARILKVAEEVKEEYVKSKGLQFTLAAQLFSKTDPERALTAARGIKDEDKKSQIHDMIAEGTGILSKTEPERAAVLFSKILKAAQEIKGESNRSRAVTAVAEGVGVLTKRDPQKASELFIKIQKAAEEIRGDYDKSLVLTKIAQGLLKIDPVRGNALLIKAQKVAEKIYDYSLMSKSLIKIAQEFSVRDPERAGAIISNVLKAIKDIGDSRLEADAYAKLVKGIGVLSKTDPERALKIAEGIGNVDNKTKALAEIVKGIGFLSKTDPEQALNAAEKIENIGYYGSDGGVENYKSKALAEIVKSIENLSKRDLKRATALYIKVLKAFNQRTDSASDFTFIVEIAQGLSRVDPKRVSELFTKALKTAKIINVESLKAEALDKITTGLKILSKRDPKSASAVFTRVLRDDEELDVYNKLLALAETAQVLSVIDPKRSAKVFAKAIRVANSIKEKYDKSAALTAIAHGLSKIDPERSTALYLKAFNASDWIKGSRFDHNILVKIAKGLSKTDSERALEVFKKAFSVSIGYDYGISINEPLLQITKSIGDLMKTDPERASVMLAYACNVIEGMKYETHKSVVFGIIEEMLKKLGPSVSFKSYKAAFRLITNFDYSDNNNRDNKDAQKNAKHVLYLKDEKAKTITGLLPSMIYGLRNHLQEPASKYKDYLRLTKKVAWAYQSVLKLGPLEPPLAMRVNPRFKELYPSLTHAYGESKERQLSLFKSLELANYSSKPVTFRLIAGQNEYFEGGKFAFPVQTLKPDEEKVIPFPVLFHRSFVTRNLQETSAFNLKLTAVEINEKNTSDKPVVLAEEVIPFRVKSSHTMVWGDEEKDLKFASFIHAPDELGDFIKDKKAQIALEGERFIFPPLREAMKIHAILTSMEFFYKQTGFTSDNTDDVFYPVETFMTRSGNCSSLTALFCALLEKNNIETGYYVTDRHVFTLINTGVRAEDSSGTINRLTRYMISPEKDDLITIEGSPFYWIPFETTALGYNRTEKRPYTFMEGWKLGVNSYKGGKHEAVIMTRDAWRRGYVPMEYPVTKWKEQTWKDDQTRTARDQYRKVLEVFKSEKYARSLSEIKKRVTKGSPESLTELGLFFALNGDYKNALAEIQKGLKIKKTGNGFNALGNIYAIGSKVKSGSLKTELQKALAAYEKGLAVKGISLDVKAKLLINMAVLYERKHKVLDRRGSRLARIIRRIDRLPDAKDEYRELYDRFVKSLKTRQRAAEVDEDLRSNVLW